MCVSSESAQWHKNRVIAQVRKVVQVELCSTGGAKQHEYCMSASNIPVHKNCIVRVPLEYIRTLGKRISSRGVRTRTKVLYRWACLNARCIYELSVAYGR